MADCLPAFSGSRTPARSSRVEAPPREAKSRPGHDLGHNNADSRVKARFEQAVKFFAFGREVGKAKCQAGHDLGHKNRAKRPIPILAQVVDGGHSFSTTGQHAAISRLAL
jgi:hypothetical protein